MQKWFSRHPRTKLVVVCSLAPLCFFVDAVFISVHAGRDAVATIRDDIYEYLKDYRRFAGELWHEAFPRKGA